MTDIDLLKSRGITRDALKKLFSSDPSDRKGMDEEALKRVDALMNRIRSRVQEGMTRNLKDWRYLYALDVAWETPFRQINPRLLQSLMESKQPFGDSDEMMSVVKGLGLERMITDEVDAKGEKTGRKMIDAPSFFNILVPLVKSYVTIRLAKIVNDRINNGFLDYDTSRPNTLNRLRCEALNARVHVMESQYSYVETFRKFCLNTLHYGTAISFIMEEWDSEMQLKKATADDVALGVKKKDENNNSVNAQEGDLVEIVTKEGLRYKIPHPSRQYRDLDHPLHTLNSDCGCAFVGYWSVLRYRDLLNKGFWNIKSIAIGNASITGEYSAFFQTVYSGCKLKIPCTGDSGDGGAGVGKNDAEKQLANQFYGTDQYDQGVVVTNHFEKLIPSENGLGDYPYPVWFRFLVASDSCTVLYACPLPAAPAWYAGYDPDDAKDKNASMSLEVLPFQDQFGMVLSQIVLSAKQNLANLTIMNSDILDDETKRKVQNMGEGMFRYLNVITASFKKLQKLGRSSEPAEATTSFTLPKANVAELTNVLKTILDVLERVLMMSNVEIAQPASHEQSSQEISQLGVSTTNRVAYTGISIDGAMDAWKRQIYEYLMAYGDPEFYAHIPADPPLSDAQLNILGFTTADEGKNFGTFIGDKFRRVKVSLKKLLIPLYEFANCNFNVQKHIDAKTAAAIAQVVQPLMSNALVMQALGAEQIVEIANQVGKLIGWDDDFRLRVVNPVKTPDEQKQEAQQQLQKVMAMVMKAVDQKVLSDVKPLVEKVGELAQAVQKIESAMGVASPQPPPQNVQPGQPTPNPVPSQAPPAMAQPAGV